MKIEKFDTWVKKILATEEEEISCSECFDLLPEVVEVEIYHKPNQEYLVKVKQHLHQCQVCQEEYEILHDLARMDAAGENPAQEE